MRWLLTATLMNDVTWALLRAARLKSSRLTTLERTSDSGVAAAAPHKNFQIRKKKVLIFNFKFYLEIKKKSE